ncbi:MAG TPA: UvrD-helicase domain-containing protein [Patescibacteria group bacterium]
MKDLLQLLNPKQLEAVIHPAGPAMVLAGAGSGKTRVLTTRVAWLIKDQGIEPQSILLVTFTNKAAAEMNHRVAQFTGSGLPLSGTFHSICAKILRRHGYAIGLDPSYTIYDADDQLSVLKQLYKEHGYSVKEFNPNSVKATISTAKNEMISPAEYEAMVSGRFQDFAARMYKLYNAALQKQRAVDFDDLMLLTVKLLQTDKHILSHFQELLSHVLVDEYQDTNKVQYELTKLFARPHNNVYVVGDFAQSIYTWRGADYRNMLHLKQDFDGLTEYKLEQNYRSTQAILDAATSVISHATSHPVLSLWTDNNDTQPLTVFETSSGEEEAAKVLDTITNDLSNYSYNDVVILYRTNAQSRLFEEACMKRGVPYRLVGGFKFYERKEIKDLLAYLRYLINRADDVSHTRIEKLGKRRLHAFEAWIEKNAATDWINQPPLKILESILEATNYVELFDDKDPEDLSRLENIKELLNVASQFSSATQFLENIALVQDNYMADLADGDTRSAVTLMSLHSAKGLEFPVVFMVGMEEGLLPHSRSLMDKGQMEEERRLCYVGITRAQEKLYFSYARRRYMYGNSSYTVRSRFLNDIPEELLNIITTTSSEYNQPHFNSFSTNPKLSPLKERVLDTKRKLIMDDETMNDLLSGDMDIEAFLDS